MAGLCMDQSTHWTAQSLEKPQGLLRRGRPASQRGMEQEQLQGRSEEQQDNAGDGFDGGWASSRQDMVTTRGLASVILMIIEAITFLGWVSVKMTLKEIFEIFNSLVVKIALTMANIVLNVFLGKRVEKNDFCFIVIKFFLIITACNAFWKRV